MKVDLNKHYRTRSGNRVILFTTGAPDPYPVVGVVQSNDGVWDPEKWTIDGRYYVSSKDTLPKDLVEVRQEHTVYVNIRKDGHVEVFSTRDNALSCACGKYKAVAVPLTYKDGDNLDLLPD